MNRIAAVLPALLLVAAAVPNLAFSQSRFTDMNLEALKRSDVPTLPMTSGATVGVSKAAVFSSYATRGVFDAAFPISTTEDFESSLLVAPFTQCLDSLSALTSGPCYGLGELESGIVYSNDEAPVEEMVAVAPGALTSSAMMGPNSFGSNMSIVFGPKPAAVGFDVGSWADVGSFGVTATDGNGATQTNIFNPGLATPVFYGISSDALIARIDITNPPAVADSAGELIDDLVLVDPLNLGVNIVASKVFLEGPYLGSGAMRTTLLDGSHVPLTQPYSDAIYTGTALEYSGSESVSTIPAGAVDWLVVSVRTDLSPGSEVGRMAAFVLSDGTIANTAGADTLQFKGVFADSLYLVVGNRNHLSVMSPIKLPVDEGPQSWDFTTAMTDAYSGDRDPMVVLVDGSFGMGAGDGNVDGQITVPDFNLWLINTKAVATGYQQSDYTFDAQVTASDFNDWLVNTKAVRKSQVP